jgi:hypothetical protein
VPVYENVTSGIIKNVRFANIVARSESGIVVYGQKETILQDLSFDGIHLTLLPSPLEATYGGNFDLRPTMDKAAAIFKHDIPGIFLRYVNGVRIQNLDLDWQEPLADSWSHGIEVEEFEGLTIDGFKGKQGSKNNSGAALALATSQSEIRRRKREQILSCCSRRLPISDFWLTTIYQKPGRHLSLPRPPFQVTGTFLPQNRLTKRCPAALEKSRTQ